MRLGSRLVRGVLGVALFGALAVTPALGGCSAETSEPDDGGGQVSEDELRSEEESFTPLEATDAELTRAKEPERSFEHELMGVAPAMSAKYPPIAGRGSSLGRIGIPGSVMFVPRMAVVKTEPPAVRSRSAIDGLPPTPWTSGYAPRRFHTSSTCGADTPQGDRINQEFSGMPYPS